MVAYQGNVDFAFEGGGASKFIKKALTGEGLPLMRCQGQGDVFLAERAFDVHLLHLNNTGLSIRLATAGSIDFGAAEFISKLGSTPAVVNLGNLLSTRRAPACASLGAPRTKTPVGVPSAPRATARLVVNAAAYTHT